MCCTVTRAIREDNIPSWKTVEKKQSTFCEHCSISIKKFPPLSGLFIKNSSDDLLHSARIIILPQQS